MDLDDIRPGDEFDLIVELQARRHRRGGGGPTALCGAHCHGGQPRRALMRWGQDGNFTKLRASAKRNSAQGLMRPVPGGRHPVTACGATRSSAIPGMHRGIDFHAPYGSPIYAATDGVVNLPAATGARQLRQARHGGGLGTGYAPHEPLRGFSPGSMCAGARSSAMSARRRLATGPHFISRSIRTAFRRSGSFASSPGRAMYGTELAAFRAARRAEAIKPALLSHRSHPDASMRRAGAARSTGPTRKPSA